MARNGNSPKANSKNPKDWKDFEFTDITLTEADKAHFKSLEPAEIQELDDALVTMVEGEYKLSVTGDQRNACFIVSATCKHERDDNYGYVLSARSSDFWEAMRLLAFKHTYCCKDTVWPKERQSSSWG